MQVTRSNARLALCVLALCALAGCPQPRGKQPQPSAPPPPVRAGKVDDGQLDIVVTVKPLELLVAPLLGDNARVTTLLPAGADPHSYEPRPSEAQRLAGADALLWVSEELDGWATALSSGLQVQVIELVPHTLRLSLDGAALASDAHAGHGHGAADAVDPHFWGDPAVVAAVLPRLAEVLGGLDPEHAAAYGERARAAVTGVQQLSFWAQKQLAPARGKAVLEMHPSMGYLLRRYGIESIGAVTPSPGREPTPQHVAALVKAAREGGAACVISEPQLPGKLAQTVAGEAGLPVVELDPEAAAVDRAYADYAAWFRYNVQALADALK